MSPYFANRKYQQRFDTRGKLINPLEDPLNYPEMHDFNEVLSAYLACKKACRRLAIRLKTARRGHRPGTLQVLSKLT